VKKSDWTLRKEEEEIKTRPTKLNRSKQTGRGSVEGLRKGFRGRKKKGIETSKSMWSSTRLCRVLADLVPRTVHPLSGRRSSKKKKKGVGEKKKKKKFKLKKTKKKKNLL